MKIAIVINGTRGDVQPMLALATGLLKNGHDIIFCAPPENKDIVLQYKCPFIEFGPNYRELFKKNAQTKGGATAAPSPKEMKSQTQDQIDMLPKIIEGSDMVLGVGFVLGVKTVADILKIPYRFIIFYPSILGTSIEDKLIYRMLFGFGRSLTNMVMKGFINKKRKVLGLKPIKDVWENWMGEHVIAACDRELNTIRKGVSFNFTQTGYMILPSQSELPEEVEKFISAGRQPIYIGFGSNPVSRPEKIGNIFNEVAKSTGQRLIISRGWASLPKKNTSDIIYVDEVPFDLLFLRVAAIVYHGGTGTMAAAARAGIPQIAFPFMADQFENRKQIVRLGIGPKGCNFKKLTSDSISSAIEECIANNKYKKNAMEVSREIVKSNGLKLTIDLIEKELK